MSEGKTRKIKKKYGKILEITSVERAGVIDEDKADNIAKYIKDARVITPQELAAKQSIRVSLARQILKKYEEDGTLVLSHKNGNNEIYTK